MCGIICYVGNRPAVPILLDGLRRLEYRGYDSSGLAVFENGGIPCRKEVGKIAALQAKLLEQTWQAVGGIAHTRWATHGQPSVENAHPHCDCQGRIFVVHNGIIENYQDLKTELISKGHLFRSETDSEVLAHLVEEYHDGNLQESVAQALHKVEGTYGIGVISADHSNEIVTARRGSPLVLGVCDGETFAASDVAALVDHTREVVYLEDDDIAVLTPGNYHIKSLNSGNILRQTETIDWDVRAAKKQGYPHFMLKEIFDEPETIRSAIRGRLLEVEGISKLGGLDPVRAPLLKMKHMIIVSCGTSYYAGMLGRCMIESLTQLGVEVDLASEFHHRSNPQEGPVVLAISQSGETADTLVAVREAKRKGVPVLGLVNVVGSNIARETDAGIYNHAGPEIAVASTKSFVSQLTILYLLGLFLARHRGLSVSEGQAFIRELQLIPEKVRWILDRSSQIERIARRYAGYKNFLYLGRKFNYPIALEAALKLKEISYLHAEAYAAGEMKHGPIALIDQQFPSVCIAPRDSTYEKMLSTIQEIKARNGPVIGVGHVGDVELHRICDDVIEFPITEEIFTPFLSIVPLQLFAYYIARLNGCHIDQPRNLAKSVTVA